MKSVLNTLRHLVPNPKFYGRLVDNNKDAYSSIDWVDDRTKPTWEELVAAAVEYESAEMLKSIATSIKSIAGQVILAMVPEYKQRNMLAAALRIENKQRLGTSTAEDDATAEAIIAIWGGIEAIRAKSDDLEATYIALGKDLTPSDLDSIKAELESAGN